MGRIPVYSSNQLASSAVGIPQQDRSGQIIAQGVQTAVSTAASLWGERQQKAADLASDARLADFSIAYGTGKGKAMVLYRDKPDKFPDAVKEHGNQLVEDFAKDMEPMAAESFRKKALGYVTQDTLNSVQWARSRDNEIIVGNIQKGYAARELAAQQADTPEKLKGVINSIEEFSKKSLNFLDFNSDKSLKDRTLKTAKENALSGAILTNAMATESDIMEGKYDDILTPLERKQYAKMAQNAAIYDATLEQFRSLTTSGAQISEMYDRLKQKDLPLSEVNQQLEWARLHANEKDRNGDPVVRPDFIDGLETLKKRILKQDLRSPAEKKIEAEAFQKTWEADWSNYLQGKDKVNKGWFGSSDYKAGVQDYSEVIGMYAKALKANELGIIDDSRLARIKQIMDTRLKAGLGSKNMSASISEALANAPTKDLSFWAKVYNPKDNVYAAGYHQIGKYFENRKDLSVADKQQQIEHLLVKFTQTLDELPQEQKDKLVNAETAASGILNGATVEGKYHPGLIEKFQVIRDNETGEVYHVGQVIWLNGNPNIVTGINKDTGTVQTQAARRK